MGDFLEALRAELASLEHVRFPSPKYRHDPVAFFHEILGVEPWSKQIEVLEAVRDYPRVAIASGHKVSKSHTAAGLALWFYCSFPDARVVMTSVTARQVDQILWRELSMMRARAGRCVACKRADPDSIRTPRPCPHSALIDGEAGQIARTGLKSLDFREVVGFTAREAEAVAGISGRNLLYLCDEASGIPDSIFEAIEGNRAGGARIALFSNPTRNEGEFFEAFASKAAMYKTIRISSEETPNVVEGRVVIAGLATREWIEEKKEEWGESSPLYKVRVKGEHALNEDGKIFSIHTIAEAERRWADASDEGRLFIGLDPAGASGMGDETCFAVRRGQKLLELRTFRGLNTDAHLVQLLRILREHRHKDEKPVVLLDREGAIGSELYGTIRAHLDSGGERFELVGVRVSDAAHRQQHVYHRQRDLLAANLYDWIRKGGAIPEDAKLSKELHVFEWKQQVNGLLKVTPKDEVRKLLGRSPDRYDALALAAWEPLFVREDVGRTYEPTEPVGVLPNGIIDPYASADASARMLWGGRR